jgi:hypothetical protein
MAKPPTEFMETYKIDSDEVWEVRAGGAWAVKHSALERVAAEQCIEFEPPTMIEADGAGKVATILVVGKMKERREWSIGEAAPHNCKNAYTFAMAEKRAKDRVILKLLNSHGTLYSDAEAEDFEKVNGNSKTATLPKKDAREIYTKLQREVREAQSRDQLKEWGKANADRIGILPEDWADILRLQYEEAMSDLRQREVA